MDADKLRHALTTEVDRVTAALSGGVAGTAAPDEPRLGREHLLGYREGIEFALDLLTPEGAQAPEPELRDQVERVRDTES